MPSSSVSRHHKPHNPNPGYAVEAKLVRRYYEYCAQWGIEDLIDSLALPVSDARAEAWIEEETEDALRKLPVEDLQDLSDLLQSPENIPVFIRKVYELIQCTWNKDTVWRPAECNVDDAGHLRAAGLGRLTRANYPGRHAPKPSAPIIYPDPYRETLYGPTCVIPLPICEVLAGIGADCEEMLATLAAYGYTIQPRRRKASAPLGQLELFAEAA